MTKNERVVGSFQLMKSINKSLILNIIREEEEISRAEIAKMTKLTPPTVTNLVGELLEEGIVLEGQTGPSSGGRRPIMLSVNQSRYSVVGVDVGIDSIRYVVTDLFANVIMKVEKALPPQITGDKLVKTIVDNVENLLEKANIGREKVLGIGIGIPGIIDYHTGFCANIELLDIENLALGTELEEKLRIPVIVENDVRATVLGEKWFGNARDVSNVICVNVGHVVDAGIILHDKLFRGDNNIAGQIGHTLIDLNGHTCTCGRTGCLQSVASHNGIQYEVAQHLEAGRETVLSEKTSGDPSKVDGKIVYEAAKAGDTVAIEVIKKVGLYLGIAITNLIDTINPQRIILSGGLSRFDGILDEIHEVIDERALSEESKNTQIVMAHLGVNATVIGAATLVLNEFFLGDLTQS